MFEEREMKNMKPTSTKPINICVISDCEKSLENVPTNVYESVCGSEISDFLGNQRSTPNSQSYTNSKPFSSITNGKYAKYILFCAFVRFILSASLHLMNVHTQYLCVIRPQRMNSGQIDQIESSDL